MTSTTAYRAISAQLKSGGLVLLDGATGTELERRGAKMDQAAWCAVATRTHPKILRNVHDDYIKAGCDVITANTFASAPWMLKNAALEGESPSLIRQAVEIACDARDEVAAKPVAVAGSLSCMRPVLPGGGSRDPGFEVSETEARAVYSEMAKSLADSGCDLILLEMMGDLDHGPWAVEAAQATGLPVWVGFSVKRAADGRIVSFREHDASFEEVIDSVLATGADAAGVMHSDAEVTGSALSMLKQRWEGPLMAYPESGHFEMPNWRFVDVMTPDQFATKAKPWVDNGVQIVGGCCGLGPAHIRSLRGRLGIA